MNLLKNKLFISIACVVIVIIIVILVIIFGNKDIKLEYEINLDTISSNYSYSEMSDDAKDVGIQCGSVKIKLGQLIDITPYTVEEEIESGNVMIKKLLAPSKKYELVVVGFERIWYVHEIRTTFPDVYSLAGYTIGDTKKDVNKIVELPSKSKISYKNTENTQVNLQFISNYLVVINLKCV